MENLRICFGVFLSKPMLLGVTSAAREASVTAVPFPNEFPPPVLLDSEALDIVSTDGGEGGINAAW